MKIDKIEKRQFEALCHIQCTEAEICNILDVTDKTLARWCKKTYGKKFSEVFREKRAGGLASLRRKQWNLADTSAAMAIFLGKNMLGQRDKFDVDAEVSGSVTVNITGEDELPD